MRLRKAFSIFIAMMMVVMSFSSAVLADGDTTAIEISTGLSLELPSDFMAVWYGMSDDDPMLEEYGSDPEFVRGMYEQGSIELQGGYDPANGDPGNFFFTVCFEKDAPETLDEDAFLDAFAKDAAPFSLNQQGVFDIEEDIEGEIYRGTIQIGDLTVYKMYADIVADYTLKYTEYCLVTEDGKMHSLMVMLVQDSDADGEPIPFSDDDLAYYAYTLECIEGSLAFDGTAVNIDGVPYEGPVLAASTEDSGDVGEAGTTTPADSTPKPTKAPEKTFFKSFTEFEFPVWILAGAMVILLLAGSKVNKKLDWQEEPFALDTSKCIQGFAAVAIIIHHLTQNIGPSAGPLAFMSECGVLFVGIFFFFSGYGLYTSLKTKKDYLKSFLKKRYVTILVPFYMCIFVFVIAACIGGMKFEGWEIPAVLSGWSLLNSHMWYIVEIAILYLVFFALYSLIKNRTVATVLMSAFVLGMMYFSLQLAHGDDYSCPYWFMGEWWYNSSLLFIVGIIVSKHADGLRKIARKIYWVLVPVLGFLVWFLGKKTFFMLQTVSYWSEEPGGDPAIMDKLKCLSVQLPWILCFVLLLLLIMMKVRFGNPVLKFLGSISLELYLSHNLFLTGLQEGSIFRVKSASMYMILTILMAIGFATIISGVDKYIVGLITGKKRDDLKLEPIARIHSIDVMRIVMAFFVVAIHCPFSGKAGDVFVTYGKTAVPFFLVVCGYMLFREDSAEMMKRLLKQTKRIAIFYVLANIFYAGVCALYSWVMMHNMSEFTACFKTKPLMDFLLYNFSPFSEHLWYLGSLLYALLIMLLLNKLKVLKHAAFAGPVLVAAYVILLHMGIGEGYQLRNAILVGMGYTLTGMLIRRFAEKILSIKFITPVLLILFAVCCGTAIVELTHYKQGTAVPFVSCEILTVVLMLLCLRFPKFGMGTFAEKLGRECSLPIYILHISVMMLFFMTNNDKFFGDFGAVTVFVVTAAIAGAYKSIRHAIGEVSRESKAPAEAAASEPEAASVESAEVATEKV